MKYRIELLATFKKEAKRLKKHYPSFVDDYERLIDELENNPHTITANEIEELLRKNELQK